MDQREKNLCEGVLEFLQDHILEGKAEGELSEIETLVVECGIAFVNALKKLDQRAQVRSFESKVGQLLASFNETNHSYDHNELNRDSLRKLNKELKRRP